MTRKHFKELARIIQTAKLHVDKRGYIASCLADMCQRANPHFDRERFLAACDVDE